MLGAAVLAFAIFSFYSAKWGLANSISTRADDAEISEFAAGLSPNDSQTRYAHGVLLRQTFDPADAERSLAEFEAATALAPHNYLLWLDYGRALEQSGDRERAVAAFRTALELAPNYAQPKWILGNALLRQGDTESSVRLITEAAETEERFAEAAAATLRQVFDGDLTAVTASLGSAPGVRSRLIPILAREQRFEEAMAMWSLYSAEEKRRRFADAGKGFADALIAAKRYRDAIGVLASISTDRLSEHGAGKVIDGDLEQLGPVKYRSVFEWRFADGATPLVGASEGQKRGGRYSLLISFPPASTAFREIAQTVAVEPGRTYEFQIYVRSALKTNAVLRWQAVDLATGERLAATSDLAPAGEWSAVTFRFTAGTGDGVDLKLVKECPAGTCPIEGSIWFDDASLRTAEQ